VNAPKPLSLNTVVNHILVNIEKTHRELGRLTPKFKYQMKEVRLNIVYYDYSEEPLPEYFYRKKTPWSRKQLKRFFKKNDREITLNYLDISQKPEKGIFQLQFELKR
jgi:hypothetical protein